MRSLRSPSLAAEEWSTAEEVSADRSARDLDARSEQSIGARPARSSIRSPRPSGFKDDQVASGRSSIGRRMFGTLARFFIVVLIGVGATLAWQSYGDQAKEMLLASPHRRCRRPRSRSVSPRNPGRSHRLCSWSRDRRPLPEHHCPRANFLHGLTHTALINAAHDLSDAQNRKSRRCGGPAAAFAGRPREGGTFPCFRFPSTELARPEFICCLGFAGRVAG